MSDSKKVDSKEFGEKTIKKNIPNYNSNMIGKTILNWKITDFIGAGNMCEVWRAENEDLEGSYAAIKCLKKENSDKQDLRNRFEEEAKRMIEFQRKSGEVHKNIIEIKNFKKEKENDYLITEYVEGKTLKSYIKNEIGPVPPEKTNTIFAQILDACKHMHKYHLIHRDLKPENIMIKPSGRIKILDFGIAKFDDDILELTQAGVIVGSPKYMSPEQIKAQKKIDHRSDIYTLGVILYELLTGKYCFPDAEKSKSLPALSLAITQDPLPSIKQIIEYLPSSYDELIAFATAKKKEDRAQNCDELINKLNKIIGNKSLPITIKLSNEYLRADINIDGINKIANEISFNGNIGESYPLKIHKKGYKKINSVINVNATHESNNVIELNLKKKFLWIF